MGGIMGGSGSGRWYRWQTRKTTVEESLAFSVRPFRKLLQCGGSGSLVWTWSGGGQSSISYIVEVSYGEPTVTLCYRTGNQEDIQISVRMEVTATNFSGWRWWFTCPLIVNGVACRRRVGKMYLPPGAKYFGCRKCHHL